MLGGNGDNHNPNKFKGYISHSILDKKDNKKYLETKNTLCKNFSEKNLKSKIIVKSTKVH